MESNSVEIATEKVIDAINSSVTYINTAAFLLFVAVANTVFVASSVTDRALLLNKGLWLPFAKVDVPLVGFFFVAPTVLVLLHINLVIQGYLLSRRIDVLRCDNTLPVYLGNQLVASVVLAIFERPERPQGIRFLLLTLYAAGIMIVPAIVLLMLQVQFLPYHSAGVTAAHRAWLVVDLIVVGYCGWLSHGHKDLGQELAAILRQPSRALKGSIWPLLLFFVTAVIAVVFSFCVAVIPGGLLDRLVGLQACAVMLHRNLDVSGQVLVETVPTPEILSAAGDSTDAISKAWLRSSRGIFLGGRHLEGANFSAAFVSNANFSQAHLEGAKFFEAHLEGSNFNPIYSRDLLAPREGNSELPTAGHEYRISQWPDTFALYTDFREAKLLGADLSAADFRGARFDKADLRQAKLVGTKLSRSSLEGARLRFADLSRTDLHGAQLQDADLLGASLVRTVLTGASLIGAHLQLTNLSEAHLEAANVVDAHLEGAEMVGTILRGGDFRGSWLWGVKGFWSNMVDLRLAHLAGADLCSSTERGEPGPRDSDFRGVDFFSAPAAVWKGLEEDLRKDTVQGWSDGILERRLEEARKRQLCVPPHLNIAFSRLLYDQEGLPDTLATWGQPRIDEETLYAGVVDWLVGEGCTNKALANALEKRARHQVVPGNFVEEHLLVRAMKARAAEDPQCVEGKDWGALPEDD